MAQKNRLAGRFLPSRIYARWKWTVRFGLCAVPLLLFLEGGMALYFKPNRYESSAKFEYLGKRSLSEVEALLKSRNLLEISIRDHELTRVLSVDIDTAVDIVSDSLVTRLDLASGMFTVRIALTHRELARDLAASLPLSLEKYENKLASQNTKARLEVAEKSLSELEQSADEKQQMLSKIIATRGDQAADSIGRLDVDAARLNWEHAHQQVLAAQSKVLEFKRKLVNPEKWVTIHSQPQIAHKAVNKKGDKLFGAVVLQALGVGLAFALLIPYLLELAFPRQRRLREVTQDLVKEGAELVV